MTKINDTEEAVHEVLRKRVLLMYDAWKAEHPEQNWTFLDYILIVVGKIKPEVTALSVRQAELLRKEEQAPPSAVCEGCGVEYLEPSPFIMQAIECNAPIPDLYEIKVWNEFSKQWRYSGRICDICLGWNSRRNSVLLDGWDLDVNEDSICCWCQGEETFEANHVKREHQTFRFKNLRTGKTADICWVCIDRSVGQSMLKSLLR